MRYSVPRHKRLWPGILLGVITVTGLTAGVLWRSDKLVMAALGATPPKVVKTEEPSRSDRDLLNLIIEKEVSNGNH